MLHDTLEQAYTNEIPVSWDLFENKEMLESISVPLFEVFCDICDDWGVNIEGRLRLLGGIIKSSAYSNWKSKDATPNLNMALLERISLVLGIHKALMLLFVNESKAHEWLISKNHEPVFAGQSPLEFMQKGPVEPLYRTRRYLDSWRGIK